jgi:flagellar hook-length control protein FliK
VLLIPSEARLAAVANASNLAGNSSAVGSTEASKIQADSMVGGLNSLIAAAPALSNGLVDASGSTANTQAVSAPALGLAANAPKDFDPTPAKSKATPAGDGMPLAVDLRAASASMTNTQAVSTPALGLAANAPKDFDPTPAKSKATPAGNNMPLAADPQAVTAPSDVADKGLSDPSFGQALVADTVPFAGTGTLALPAGATMQQPGSVSTPSVPASTVSVILLPEVGSNEWGKALSQQVIQLSTGDRQIAEIQLNPPGLGPLKVTLSVSDQQMQAAFVSAHSSVRAAVETALPQLRALLAESGISLGQTSVGAESQPQTAFASGQGSFANQSPRQGYSDRDAGMVAPLSSQSTAVKLRPGQGLRIDTYA